MVRVFAPPSGGSSQEVTLFVVCLRTTAYTCYSAYYAIARPSVCLSVCPSVTDQSKTVAATITKFSPYGSPIPLFFASKFHPEILRGSHTAGAYIRVW